ncbi:MAG: glycosyltransferase [Sphingobacteriia bacterium]|nr:glycosyltransferase [Sphingobacteriia bacterium]
MIVILSSFTVIYCVVIMLFIYGWHTIPIFKSQPEKTNTLSAVSIVICCRNEENRLMPLIDSIKKQSYQNFEVIFANDHSTDNSLAILLEQEKENNQFRVINTTHQGKKIALREAIAITKNPLIFCCDADCTLPVSLLEKIVSYHLRYNPDLLIGGVKYTANNFFQTMQATEFGSLMASAAGSCGVKMPILCSGANLSFPISTWKKYAQNLNDKAVSGDDMFLMLNVKHNQGNIQFLKSPDAFVTTQPADTTSDFFNQHQRWSAKTTLYHDWQTIFVAITVFAWCLIWIIAVIHAFFNVKIWGLVILTWCIKLFCDGCLLIPFFNFSQQKKAILTIIPAAVTYPFYIVYTAISGLFTSFRWKNSVAKK